jgi:hypothetical protein
VSTPATYTDAAARGAISWYLVEAVNECMARVLGE